MVFKEDKAVIDATGVCKNLDVKRVKKLKEDNFESFLGQLSQT